MSNDITNLMQQVYDYFLNLYHQAQAFETETHNTFLTFEPVGTPITPEMFKLHHADPTFSQPLAIEVFSTLANVVPAINADVFQPTGKTVDDFYKMLLVGSEASPQSGNSALFAALRRQAQMSFDQISPGSLQGPFPYKPAYATPGDWFDASNEANWTPYSFTNGTPPPPPPPPAGGSRTPQNYIPIQKRAWAWRVPPEEAAPIVRHPAMLEQMSIARPAAGMSNMVMKALSFDAATEAAPEKAGEAASLGMGIGMMATEGFSPIADTIETQISAASAATSDVAVQATPLQPVVEDTVVVQDEGIIAVNRPRIVGSKLAEIVDTGTSTPVQSNYLKLSLKYCLVRINRPWFSQAFLTTRDWYLPGFEAGGIAHGTAASSNDPFPALPVACLVVKDLQITTDTSEITGVAQHSAAFGPFSLVGQTVSSADQTNSTLTVNGIQIIGWICQIMPPLPPAPDPSLPAPPAGTTPPTGTTPSAAGTSAPADGATPSTTTTPSADGTTAPADGTTPPAATTSRTEGATPASATPPADGATAPADGSASPATATTPPADGATAPADGTPPPPSPTN